MVYYNQYLKDVLDNNYVGISINKSAISNFLTRLKEYLGEELFHEYTTLKKDRDGESYHLTVVNPIEYNNYLKNSNISNINNQLERVFDYEIDDLKFKGVGTASRNENTAYFIVCESDKLKAIRNSLGLGDKDFHITLGFKFKDVHGVRKNETIDLDNKFIGKLKRNFYKEGNWNFIKDIKNFDNNLNSEIIPISINKSSVKFLVDDTIIIISLLDDEFGVSAEFKNKNKVSRLPQTEILKILNK